MGKILDELSVQVGNAVRVNHREPDYVLMNYKLKTAMIEETFDVTGLMLDPNALRCRGAKLIFTSSIPEDQIIPVFKQVKE